MKAETIEREEYVSRVLRLYLGLAETPGRSSRLDRRLAEELYEKQIELEEVEAAMILAELSRRRQSDGVRARRAVVRAPASVPAWAAGSAARHRRIGAVRLRADRSGAE